MDTSSELKQYIPPIRISTVRLVSLVLAGAVLVSLIGLLASGGAHI
jgi:hypothetical protein